MYGRMVPKVKACDTKWPILAILGHFDDKNSEKSAKN
jgi:hypothetical protein